ncbi:sensor histidine kinase, partial [Devosia sp.]|uniref:sensor histidine kinase n=1 Tax=Devosia sp. TaxID=1871048 RepID=UPI002F124D97
MANQAADDIAGAARRGSRPARPIALYLFILALVALVPAFVFSAVLLQRNNETQQRVAEALMVGTARSIVQAVEREIAANITTLKVLATAPTLVGGDLRSFHARVKAALEGTGANIYLLDARLHSVMSTRTEFGATPVPAGDTETPQRALATGDVAVSDVVLGTVSGRWVINILYPLPQPSPQAVAIGFNRNADDLTAALLGNKLPDGWYVALLDRKDAIIASSPGGGPTGEIFSLADAGSLGASSSGWTTLVAEDGTTQLAVVQKSPLTGWTLVAWAPRDLVARPLSEAFWSLAVGGVLLAAMVILAIYWVGLQIGRSVHGLKSDAMLLGAGRPVPARAYPISEIATVSRALAEASRRRQAAETEVRFLMRELAHRSKNQMTVIAAMAKQTARNADSVAEFIAGFEKRIHGLARSTDLLLAHGIAGVDFRELLAHQIDVFCPVDRGRVRLDGPALRLNTQAAQILGMAAHELATNAVKYGAFASDSGTLAVTWRLEADRLLFTWRESVHKAPRPSRRRGFGTTVLENMVGRALAATVKSTMHADGIEWNFDIPAAGLHPDAVPDDVAAAALRTEAAPGSGSAQPAV